MANNINICISCNDNNAKYAGVTIASVLMNAGEDDEFSFYIIDDGISDKTKLRIERLKRIRSCDINYINVDPARYALSKKISNRKDISSATLYILKLTELLPRVDRIIYLDSDIIVRKSLAEFYYTNLDDKYIAGVLDTRAKYSFYWRHNKYINPGVILFDLNQIRWNSAENVFTDYIERHLSRIQISEGDIINFSLDKKIKIVDDKWNIQVANFWNRNNYTNDPYVIHYVGNQKPWKFASYNHFKNEYFKVLSKTPWSISQEERYKWGIWNDFCSLIYFILDNPLFLFRFRFWTAVVCKIIQYK